MVDEGEFEDGVGVGAGAGARVGLKGWINVGCGNVATRVNPID